MSNNIGSAYGANGEIMGMALGDIILDGAAHGNTVIWTQGSLIHGVISAPISAAAGATFEITINANRQTEYVVTYTVNGSTESGVSRNITHITDMPDGTRQITFAVSFGSRGTRTLRVYGATQQSNATSYRSLNFVDIPITITN